MTLRKVLVFKLLLLLLAFPVRAAENVHAAPLEIPATTTQTSEGRIFFPAAAASLVDDTLTWQYRPTRWGQYELFLAYAKSDLPAPSVNLEIAGKTFRSRERPPSPDNTGLLYLGRFYLPKAEPYSLTVQSDNPGERPRLQAVVLLPAPEGKPIVQTTNSITLHARDATTHSVMMRYEPATNKNCLGYWTNPKDYATWTFEVTKPGTYDIELWQGCGKGQGGSEVAVALYHAPAELHSSTAGQMKPTITFTVEDTGHFQNFIPRNLGQINFPRSSRYTLAVKPISKKAAAVMDIRQILLKPVQSSNVE